MKGNLKITLSILARFSGYKPLEKAVLDANLMILKNMGRGTVIKNSIVLEYEYSISTTTKTSHSIVPVTLVGMTAKKVEFCFRGDIYLATYLRARYMLSHERSTFLLNYDESEHMISITGEQGLEENSSWETAFIETARRVVQASESIQRLKELESLIDTNIVFSRDFRAKKAALLDQIMRPVCCCL